MGAGGRHPTDPALGVHSPLNAPPMAPITLFRVSDGAMGANDAGDEGLRSQSKQSVQLHTAQSLSTAAFWRPSPFQITTNCVSAAQTICRADALAWAVGAGALVPPLLQSPKPS